MINIILRLIVQVLLQLLIFITVPLVFEKNNNIKSCSAFQQDNIFDIATNTTSTSTSSTILNARSSSSPNLIIIMTDQQNFRTLGCYRNIIMSPSERFVWGEGNFVKTPHIDKLARKGALFTKFYSTLPICTPSRASFMTGLYPHNTNVINNSDYLSPNITMFTDVLSNQGYDVAYMGKWHLNGKVAPGYIYQDSPPAYSRGFHNTKYMWNRGHFKFLWEDDKNGTLKGSTYSYGFKQFKTSWKDVTAHYTTDYLFNKATEYIKTAYTSGKKFALILSIPDPHDPFVVRAPYRTMYKNNKFKIPITGRNALQRNGYIPGWMYNTLPDQMNQKEVDELENSEFWQNSMANYFGMVKHIDDRVGQLMGIVNNKKNTIVVYTSDHGGLSMEHGSMYKAKPYEASAKVPMIISYPEKVTEMGKKIYKPYTSVDFAPTILSLMGIPWRWQGYEFDGIDASYDLLSNVKNVNDFNQTRIFLGPEDMIAAVTSRFKLITFPTQANSASTLFDLKSDPDEMINYYYNKTYADVVSRLNETIYKFIQKYYDPVSMSPGSASSSTPTS